MAFINSAPLYRNGDIVLGDDGNVEVSYNDIESEILERLESVRGSFPFNEDYGSDIKSLQNSRGNLSAGDCYNIVKDALQPMIDSGRIKNDLLVNRIINGNLLNIIIKVTANVGGIVTANYKTFLR